jgi:hypothetical protein
MVVGLFTGNRHLEGHLFKLGLTDDPICERCLEEDKSATHILCDCEAIAYLIFRHLGQFFMEPSNYCDALINKALQFIRSVGFKKGKHDRSLKVAVQGPDHFGPPLVHSLEYLHRSPASRRTRRKGNPVRGGITGPPCH